MFSIPLDPTAARFAHEAMNTRFEFQLRGSEPSYLREAAAAAFAEIDRLEDLLSLYRAHSDVARLNAAGAGETVRVAEPTAACLRVAMEVAARTFEAFHPFCGEAALCGKGQADWLPARPAAPGPIAGGGAILALDAEGTWATKRVEGRVLDLGAIGKGFALDEAARLLAEWGLCDGLLIAGGSSFRALGSAQWNLRGADGRWVRPLAGNGLASSGSRTQPMHLVDPRTGRAGAPADRRASAAAPSAAEADALATASIFLSCPEIERVCASHPGYSIAVSGASGQRSWGRQFLALGPDGAFVPSGVGPTSSPVS